MTTKLIIHKFDSDVQIQTLKITIQDDETSTITYSDWSESKTQPKNDAPKASRLVVKLVSGNDPNYFNLDDCAEKIEYNEVFTNTGGFNNNSFEFKNTKRHVDNFNTVYDHFENYQNNKNTFTNNIDVIPKKDIKNENSNVNSIAEIHIKQHMDVMTSYEVKNINHSPLEYSLERVKENNARIMKNIHILNRTLNYTKEKEFMDNICSKSMRSFPCNTCGKCFVYETGLKRHNSVSHSLGQVQPRWQVVWTCIECYQVWPRQDLAFKHSRLCCKTETNEYTKEIRTSLLLQCEFCEKVFTSMPRLLKHSKGHTTAKNYECNPCNMVFLSYKTAEQHWILCAFLKICYNFTLPRMLVCNACDRKFKNYELLYSHRYKESHFTSKIQHSRGNAKCLGMLVYQCEICGQWFTSSGPLQNHRQHSHPPIQNNNDHVKDPH